MIINQWEWLWEWRHFLANDSDCENDVPNHVLSNESDWENDVTSHVIANLNCLEWLNNKSDCENDFVLANHSDCVNDFVLANHSDCENDDTNHVLANESDCENDVTSHVWANESDCENDVTNHILTNESDCENHVSVCNQLKAITETVWKLTLRSGTPQYWVTLSTTSSSDPDWLRALRHCSWHTAEFVWSQHGRAETRPTLINSCHFYFFIKNKYGINWGDN